MTGLFATLAAWAPLLGLGFGTLWALWAFIRKHPILGILALFFCIVAGQLGWFATLIAIILFGWMVVAEPKFLRAMASNFSVTGELVSFLWERKLWWMIPVVVMLMGFGLLMVFASASGIGPFVYTLF